MQGASKYASLFTTGQHGRLYLVSGSHARGRTFHIYVLPDGEKAVPNGPNAPLNTDKVEVYGIVGGQPGWTEFYGWLHHGPWVDDFEAWVQARQKEVRESKERALLSESDAIERQKQRNRELLATYLARSADGLTAQQK